MSTTSTQTPSPAQARVVLALVLAGSAIGLIMSMQSVSLLTGTGTLWTGAAIASAAAVGAVVLRDHLRTWVRVVAILVAVIAVSNVIYLEHQLDQKREEIQHILDE
jgi:multidrug transporter EmrE-like cation transporter